MKNALFATVFTVAASSMLTYAQQPNAPVKSPRVTVDNELFSIAFGQPSKNERKIFGDLVPFGKVWRTGANMSTDITFKKDVVFGGKKVKKGTYALFTIPQENGQWKVILNSVAGQKGTYEYDANKSKNVAEVKGTVATNTSVEEKLNFDYQDHEFKLMWDDVIVSVPVK